MDAYAHVENIIKQSSISFYKAFSYLPKEKANAVFAIYGFCRTADDAVDIHKDQAFIDGLKEDIKSTFKSNPPKDDPIFIALSDTLKKYPNDETPYLNLLSGMDDDLNHTPIQTEKDLDDYCFKVASTVGLMLLPVIAEKALKEDEKKIKEVAIELGKAMQITNILRDVKEDLMASRVYFPDEILKKHNVLEKTMRVGTVTPEYQSMIEYYIEMAKEKYQVFYQNAHLFDKDAIKPTYYAATFYEGILDEIRRSKYRNLTKRLYVSKFRKFLLMKKAQKELRVMGL